MKNISKVLMIGLITMGFGLASSAVTALNVGSISGSVYWDVQCNGLDLTDLPLTQVPIKLTSTNKNVKLNLKVNTDSQGNFVFNNLAFGAYKVVVDPSGRYQPKNKTASYKLTELQGAVSDTFVFCSK